MEGELAGQVGWTDMAEGGALNMGTLLPLLCDGTYVQVAMGVVDDMRKGLLGV